jgi:hypothetical protein
MQMKRFEEALAIIEDKNLLRKSTMSGAVVKEL